jgi:hypothetical protein
MEDEVQKDATKLLSTKNWCEAAKHRDDWRKKTEKAMARERAEEP